MSEKMKWEEVYKLWNSGKLHFSTCLTDRLSVETVYVEYNRSGYIYGYDWLEDAAAQDRKQVIEKDPIQFIYFSQASNKGTIQTVRMLSEAQDQEEHAAIWIAATAFELMEVRIGRGISRCAEKLYYAALEFLRDRYVLWHHAMRKLVPEIMIPYSVLESIQCDSERVVMDLIQMNVVMIMGHYKPLLYSSIKEMTEEMDREIKWGYGTLHK